MDSPVKCDEESDLESEAEDFEKDEGDESDEGDDDDEGDERDTRDAGQMAAASGSGSGSRAGKLWGMAQFAFQWEQMEQPTSIWKISMLLRAGCVRAWIGAAVSAPIASRSLIFTSIESASGRRQRATAAFAMRAG